MPKCGLDFYKKSRGGIIWKKKAIKNVFSISIRNFINANIESKLLTFIVKKPVYIGCWAAWYILTKICNYIIIIKKNCSTFMNLIMFGIFHFL